MTDRTRTVVIVGGGFSGTVIAINLLRLTQGEPMRVVLVDPRSIGRGVAYADRPYPYLLNVPAGRMSATSAEPSEFLTYARRVIPTATAEDFLPRSLYGDYLESTLRVAELSSPAEVRLERVRGTVTSLERAGSRTRFRVHLEDGRHLTAHEVVLALGNPPPARLQAAESLTGSCCYVEDPWSAPIQFRPGEVVLVIGTGLTMADVVTSGMRTAHDQAYVHAISRHGLVPEAQGILRHGPRQPDHRVLLQAASRSMRTLFAAVRALARETEQHGGDWRDVINLLRTHAADVWRRLSQRDRRRFLRHVRAHWDVHRHRLPQETRRQIDRLRQTGRLQTHAGRILRCEPFGKQVRVAWRPRGEDQESILFVDRVVNCTGPDYRAFGSTNPLLRSLQAQKLVLPDGLGLGIRTGAFGALLDSRGRPAEGLYYIGPMLRPDHWESTAVPELRGHAERLAQRLTLPVPLRAAVQ